MANNTNNHLHKELKPIHLWGIAVGMVISGQYFGWNYGFEQGGTIGLAIAAIIVTIFYTTFIFSYSELSTSIPHAGGPSAYARKAMGPYMGFMTGLACLLEFVFAPPAIAVATGAYINFLIPSINAVYATVAVFSFFILINLIGVKGAAIIELVATILALIGLSIYYVAGLPHVKSSAIFNDMSFFNGWEGIFASIPFAIWFFLAIEGGAMAAEEVRNPKKDIPKGFISGILTLATATVLTLLVTAGLGGGEGKPADYPLPQALAGVYGENNILPKTVAIIGLFGLIASLHGIIIGYSRQTFALARAGYLPRFLSNLSKRGVPHWGLIVPGIIGVVSAGSASFANALIILSVFGAITMYCLSLISLFVLRKKEPHMERPFKVSYPVVPGIALFLGIISFFCVLKYSVLTTNLPLFGIEIPLIAVILFVFGAGSIYYFLVGAKKIRPISEEFVSIEDVASSQQNVSL
ncbi:ethanolamine permease [Geobacillus sp. 44B]|jgi:ethanolamine permease|uniref:ethanolamine permease n=1 Tax=Saccharococcus caldoxylosilyticus TaxID=81408 RepID=UPI0002E61B62|nr:ethanolamine permease [Parageobacillus caldoxylosilyticus]QNU36840.1 ethanolamine permease [Geobacillus sp. 44B]BDG36309.1 ethanolamine permease [Parageobacillus caldoxylosilyticus]BDG40095.1 ethanolamine permease [Parageobacillus caldoxylosilyticus]BDG43822.1 ethanolamine permease [Parageobacillus caldoxylosilyticus]